jgi:hypothetical protein
MLKKIKKMRHSRDSKNRSGERPRWDLERQ